MRFVSPELNRIFTIKEEVAQTIENWFPFIILPTLWAMRMTGNNAISAIINKIPISCYGLWKRNINVFYSIMRENK